MGGGEMKENNILKKAWDNRASIFMVIFFLYSIPFITSPLSGPGLFDFLWIDWGWSEGYYIAGEVILILIASILIFTGQFEPEKEDNDGN